MSLQEDEEDELTGHPYEAILRMQANPHVEKLTDENYAIYNWAELEKRGNFMMFKSDIGRAISFFVFCGDEGRLAAIERVIIHLGGRLESNFTDIHSRTVVLVEPCYIGELDVHVAFHLNFIVECYRKGYLLGLEDFVLPQYEYRIRMDTFEIIYSETGEFYGPESEASSVVNSVGTYPGVSVDEPLPSPRAGPLKRNPFTREEQEAILKFILAKGPQTSLTSNDIYREMVEYNVCPTRTFQSVKNHFLNIILYQLDTFDFLGDSDKARLEVYKSKKKLKKN